jgi:mannan endo-1,6-alpha-mannosidase
MAARLARFTGNSTYADWAEKIYDWTTATKLIDDSYRVFDGASATDNCQQVSPLQWTYTPGIFIYGSAMMYNYTNGSSTWETRLTGLIEQVDQTFFQAFDNATGVMVEGACEPYGTCNNDQYSFKAYLARFLGKAMTVAPYTRSAVQPLLTSSAQGAARSCSGPSDGVTCGQKWYEEGFDGSYGIGQELSALEVTQALLVDQAPGLKDQNDVKIETATTSSTLKPTVSIGPASVSGITSTSAMTTPTTTSTSGESSTSPDSNTSNTSEPSNTSTTSNNSNTSNTSNTPSKSSTTSKSTTSNTSNTSLKPTTSAMTTSAILTTSTAEPSSTGAGAMNSAMPRVGALIGGALIGAILV